MMQAMLGIDDGIDMDLRHWKRLRFGFWRMGRGGIRIHSLTRNAVCMNSVETLFMS